MTTRGFSMKRFAVLFVLSMLTSLLAIGCSSPKQKVEKCQKKVCSKLKSHGKKLCNSVCENKYYRDFDDEKLDSLCSDGDDIACLRASTKAFKKKDYKTVANNLKKCASKKNATCIGLMGNMYKSGKGVKKDKTKALAMFEEACEKATMARAPQRDSSTWIEKSSVAPKSCSATAASTTPAPAAACWVCSTAMAAASNAMSRWQKNTCAKPATSTTKPPAAPYAASSALRRL
jgi:TPR repeat protein